LILFALAVLSLAHGQQYLGTINGTVTDPTGAVIVGAHIQVINEDTHFVNNAVTNNVGLYAVPFLTPGTYDVKVEATTFGLAEQTGAVLVAGGAKEINFKLSPVATNATVTVTANSELLDTESASVATTLPANVIENTPNTGENVFYLATRVPGVYSNQTQGQESVSIQPTTNGITGMTFNGKSGNQLVALNGLIDSTPEGNPAGIGNTAVVTSPYTTQELNVSTAVYDAQYGHNNGGVMDAIVKNGSEQYHGDLYMIDGTTDFNSNTWNRKQQGLGRPPVDWVEPGFMVSGPLRIPKLYHGRDKTYFMVGWQHLYNLSYTPTTLSIPTLLERKGDFSELTAASGNVIYDPTTTVPAGASSSYAAWCSGLPASNGNPAGCFAGERESFTQEYSEGPGGGPSNCNGDVNCIPTSRWNSVGAILAGAAPPPGFQHSIYPDPNAASTSASVPYSGNYLSPGANTAQYFYGLVVRVDHEFNENNKLAAIFLRNRLVQDAVHSEGFPDANLGSTQNDLIKPWIGGSLDYTRVISSSLVLDARTGGFYHPYHLIREGENLNPSTLGMTGAIPAVLQNFPGTSPSGSAAGYTGLQNGVGANEISSVWDNTALLSKLLAKHTLKFGYQGTFWRDNVVNPTSALGTFSTSDVLTQNAVLQGTAAKWGGDGIASLLLGYGTGNSATTIQPTPAYAWHYRALFVNDDWRISPKLTVNLGLRYDYESPVTERHNATNAGWSFTAAQPFCMPNALGTAIGSCSAPPSSASVPQGYTGGLTFAGPSNRLPFTRELKDRWQPRFGASYRLTDRDVLRGGFGIMYAPGPVAQTNDGFNANTPFVSSINSNFTPPSCTSAQGGDAYGFCNLANPYPNGFVTPTGNLLGLSTFLGQSISVQDQHRVYPRVMLYSFGLEHQFPSQILIDVNYQGAYTSGIGVSKNINALPACFYAGGGCPGAGVTSILNASVANPMHNYMPASSSLNAATVTQQSLYLPYPEFGSVTETFSQNYRFNGNQREDVLGRNGVVNYNSLQVSAVKRVTHGLEGHVSFTLSKIMDQTLYTNPTDPNPGKFEDGSPARLFEFDMVYDVPKLESGNFILKQIVNGWRWANAENWQQGTAISVPGGAFSTGIRPVAKHQVNVGSSATASHWFNTCYIPVVSQATATSPVVYGPAQGPGPVGTACQPGESPAWIQQPSFTLNLLNSGEPMRGVRLPEIPYLSTSLSRNFPIHERITLMFRADVLNPFNMVLHYGGISTSLTSATFGQDTSIGQYNDPRIMRLKAVLSF
jgi:hypothetical protein